ncbi:MAG: DUF2269 family protein [Gammaproteobacteria bacterium]|nr:MAG: DUF2269 family protein [Gammaproteobacteria bacterium]
MPVAMSLHVLAAVIWVGGMFFAYVALRPVAGTLLEPPLRLQLWQGAFMRFFPWVWVAIIALPATGYWIIFDIYGGLDAVGLHIHAMQTLGIIMILIFLYVYFAPYKRLCMANTAKDYALAGKQLAQIRKLIAINLTLGLITIATASGGQFIV